MNINILLSAFSLGLAMIFFLFKPLDIKEQDFVDIPLFELNKFTLYEITPSGLVTFMHGSEAVKYSDRYIVNKINYTDNSKDYIANMKADHGVYKDDIVTLDGDIVYIREDGLTFETQEVQYDKTTSVATADQEYISYRGENVVTGKLLKYNNALDRVESKNVSVTYQLGDKL